MRTSASFWSSDLNANPHPLEMVSSEEKKEIEEQLRKRIADRAYQLYEQAGSTPGHHEQDWLRAEQEVVQRITQIRESGSWLIVNLHVPNVPAEGFKLLITEENALLEIEEPFVQRPPEHPERFSFYAARWPAHVEPSTASAYVKNGTMTLEVKLKANPPQAKKTSVASPQ